jgi:ABC-type transporter Mla subunit MlaD
MAAPNLFDELKDALTKFKTFLHDNVDTIKPVIAALKSVVPKIVELIDKLIELMGKLKTEIDKLNPGAVGAGLTKVTEFTAATKTLLDTAKALLPDEAAAIGEVQDIASVVSSLPSLDAIKEQLKTLIDEIVTDLNKLKA